MTRELVFTGLLLASAGLVTSQTNQTEQAAFILTKPATASTVWDFEFVGNQSFDSNALRQELELDLRIATAIQQRQSPDDLVKIACEQLATGYRAGGFSDVKVTHSESDGTYTIRIEEGPRFECGTAEVRGLPETAARSIVEQMTAMSRSPWVRKARPRFDAEYREVLRETTAVALRNEGYHFPQFDIRIDTDEQTKLATLIIDVTQAGRLQAISEVKFRGLTKNSEQQVLQFLELPENPVATRQQEHQILKKLYDSGRFVYAHASLEPPFGDDQAVPLTLTVLELDELPALSDRLSPEQQALHNLGLFLDAFPDSENDFEFQFELQGNSAIQESLSALAELPLALPSGVLPDRLKVHAVLSGNRGGIVRLTGWHSNRNMLFDVSLMLINGRSRVFNHLDRMKWTPAATNFSFAYALSATGHDPVEGNRFHFK